MVQKLRFCQSKAIFNSKGLCPLYSNRTVSFEIEISYKYFHVGFLLSTFHNDENIAWSYLNIKASWLLI